MRCMGAPLFCHFFCRHATMSFKKHLRLRRRIDYGRVTKRLSPPSFGRSLEDEIYNHDQQQDVENDIAMESAGGGAGGSIGNGLGTNTTADADDSNSNDPYYNPKGDTYEFTAFALWYLFLIMCCVVPTYCAYRRRARAARLEMEQRERRMSGLAGGSDWYVEAMAELERRRREDEAYDAAAAAATEGVDGVLAGNLMLGANGPRQGGNSSSSTNNSTDVVLFRGMSADGRPITVLAGSGTTATASPSSNAAADPSSVAGTRMRTSTTSSTDEPVRLVYLRRESSGTDDGAQDGIRSFAGLNFGSNVNPFTSVAGASWFMAAAQQREQVQREERTRILDAVLENTSMWVNDGDLLTAEDAEEVGGEILDANVNGAGDQITNKRSDGNKIRQNDGLDNDNSSSKEEEGADAVDEKKEHEEEGAIATEDADAEFPFLRLRAPMLGAIKYDPKDPDKINRIMRKHRGRIVPSSCAICLCPYAIDDEVSWSTKGSSCPHAFHTSCIKLWLSKKEEALCPCCRQQFVSVEILMKHLPAVEEDDYEQEEEHM